MKTPYLRDTKPSEVLTSYELRGMQSVTVPGNLLANFMDALEMAEDMYHAWDDYFMETQTVDPDETKLERLETRAARIGTKFWIFIDANLN